MAITFKPLFAPRCARCYPDPMKTLPLCILTLLAAVATFGCDTKAASSLAELAKNPNGPVAEALSSVTTAIFETEQPVFNAAVASLPADIQALAQVAYVALEQAAKSAEQQGLKLFAVNGNVMTQSVGAQLADVRDVLHETIHDTEAPLANSNEVIVDPNLTAIPTIIIPSMSAP